MVSTSHWLNSTSEFALVPWQENWMRYFACHVHTSPRLNTALTLTHTNKQTQTHVHAHTHKTLHCYITGTSCPGCSFNPWEKTVFAHKIADGHTGLMDHFWSTCNAECEGALLVRYVRFFSYSAIYPFILCYNYCESESECR